MKIILILTTLLLISCSDDTAQDQAEQWPKPRPGLAPLSKSDTATKKTKHNGALKGYQDNIQRAKDMEKEVLKAAEKQRKIIDG